MKKKIELREVYSVMFEIPRQPGHWTELIGRFETREKAVQWSKQLAFSSTVVLSLLEPGEATAYSRSTTLRKYVDMVETALR